MVLVLVLVAIGVALGCHWGGHRHPIFMLSPPLSGPTFAGFDLAMVLGDFIVTAAMTIPVCGADEKLFKNRLNGVFLVAHPYRPGSRCNIVCNRAFALIVKFNQPAVSQILVIRQVRRVADVIADMVRIKIHAGLAECHRLKTRLTT
jgi:hypothetical protein